MNLPMKASNFNHHGFLMWLTENGAEIGIQSNPYELIRYRALNGNGRAATHIVYRRDNDDITWAGITQDHYRLFQAEAKMNPMEPKEGVFLRTYPTKAAEDSLKAKTRQALLQRDGDECWFCGRSMGADATIEHLVPKAKGGRNMLANYALAHRSCNNRAGDLPLIQKIEMRQKMRGRVA